MVLMRSLAVGSLLFLMACAQIWGMQDLTLGPDAGGPAGADAGGPVGADATQPGDDAGARNDVADASEEKEVVDAARLEDGVASRIDGGDACASDPSWCDTHCGPGKDNVAGS